MWPINRAGAAAVAGLLVAGCVQHMADQPKVRPYEPSAFFADGSSMRPPVPHTLAVGERVGRAPRPALTRALVLRGRERYGIYCAPCHGISGDGKGIIPAHGFQAPPSYGRKDLLKAPDTHFYDVITNGYGVMYPYANRVAPADRWAITAYVRALQLTLPPTAAPGHHPQGGRP